MWALAWTGLAGVLALGSLLLWPGLRERPATQLDGLRVRGGEPHGRPLLLVLDDRGTEVAAFRTSGAEAPAPVADRIHCDAELAFAYRNGGGWPWLMVFGRDQEGTVYWFSPQWTDPATDPTAIGLQTRPGQHELPNAVAHDIEGPSLTLCALVSRVPTSTRAVEGALAGRPRASPAEILVGPDRAIDCRAVEVAP